MTSTKPWALSDAARLLCEHVDGLSTRAAQHELPLPMVLKIVEREAIRKTLQLVSWNISMAAKRLAIHRNTLSRKMDAYGLSFPSES